MQQRFTWLDAVRNGLVGGATILLVALIGMISKFSERPIIENIITMGRLFYLGILYITAFRAADAAAKAGRPRSQWVIAGLISGVVSMLVVALFMVVGQAIDLSDMFINANAPLYRELGLGNNTLASLPLMLGMGAAVGAAAGAIHLLAPEVRRALTVGVISTVLLGLLGELILLSNIPGRQSLRGWLLANKGLTVIGAAIVFIVASAANLLWRRRSARAISRLTTMPTRTRHGLNVALFIVTLLVLISLPTILGPYYSEVLNQTGIFILLGLGLNIVVGFAGMLDLGYVAFFALGAYTVGILTSPEQVGATNFWGALPVAILIALFAGVMLGIPVLRMRGDYLAIVTLGFGEIIQRLVISEWLKGLTGGAQGIRFIQPITITKIPGLLPDGLQVAGVNKSQLLFYFVLAGVLLAIFIATRLKSSRLGRAWMAIREDEDVAQAMGINLVATKLLAFGMGAAMSGLGGALFAAKVGNTAPNSFGLLVSINILALIIVGGLGSIPGVILGALVLVGLPELLREFAQFRLLVYGAVLVYMMLNRPEGLIPDLARRDELHDEEEAATYEGDAPHAEPMIATR